MIDQTEILKIARHAFKRGQGIPDKRLMHPRRDWAIGIILFTLILGVGSYYGATSFAEYLNIDTSGGRADERVPRYNAEQIETTITNYKAKEAVFSGLVSNVVAEVPAEVEERGDTSTTTASTTVDTVVVSESETEPEGDTEQDIPDIEEETEELPTEAPISFE